MLTQLGLGSGIQDHTHHEYANVRDVQDSFNKVASALDELNARLVVVEETLASMQTAQSEVDNQQNHALRDMVQRMSDFTTEMEKSVLTTINRAKAPRLSPADLLEYMGVFATDVKAPSLNVRIELVLANAIGGMVQNCEQTLQSG